MPAPAYSRYLWYLTHGQQTPKHCGARYFDAMNFSQPPSNDYFYLSDTDGVSLFALAIRKLRAKFVTSIPTLHK